MTTIFENLGSRQTWSLIKSSLLLGGIERNPGPPRKKRGVNTLRCPTCQRFVSKEKCCPCSKNPKLESGCLENDARDAVVTPSQAGVASTAEESSYVLSTVIRQLDMVIPSSEYLREHCENWGLEFATNVHLGLGQSRWVQLGSPLLKKKVPGNGDCLFHCMSVCVAGRDDHANTLRQLICDCMESVPFVPGHFERYSRAGVSTVGEYLEIENMREEGTFAGDLEIITFCHVFRLRVVVYCESIRQWLMYSPLCDSTDFPTVFFNLSMEHWEPILRITGTEIDSSGLDNSIFFRYDSADVVEHWPVIDTTPRSPPIEETISQSKYAKEERFYTMTLPCKPELPVAKNTGKIEGKEIKSSPEKEFNKVTGEHFPDFQYRTSNLPKVEQHKNHSCDDEILKSCPIDRTQCDKCKRNGTFLYPLELTSVHKEKVIDRLYGAKVTNMHLLKLCLLCAAYLCTNGDTWGYAWPSVLFSFCFGKRPLKNIPAMESFLELLPESLRQSWLIESQLRMFQLTTSPLFQDITRDLVYFKTKIEANTSDDYVEAMNQYAFPSVRCICGVPEFLDYSSVIPFNHLLNYVDHAFKSFDSSSRDYLGPIRKDFLLVCDNDVGIAIRPALSVSSEGIMLHLCAQHKGGTKNRMVHVARHPEVANLSHPHADRFAPMASSVRGSTSVKIGEFSHTWSMCNVVGGYQGAGAVQLHYDRDFSVKSDCLLPKLESVFLNNRYDMKGNVACVASEYNLSPSFVKNCHSVLFDKQKYNEYVSSATVIPFSTTAKMHQLFKTTSETDSKYDKNFKCCVLSKQFPPAVSDVPIVHSKLVQISYPVALLVFLFQCFSTFSNLFLNRPTLFVLTQLNPLLAMNKRVRPVQHVTAFVRSLSVSLTSPIHIFMESFCNKIPPLLCLRNENDLSKVDGEKCAVLFCRTRRSIVTAPQVLVAQDGTTFVRVLMETASLDVLPRLFFRHDPHTSDWFETCLMNQQCRSLNEDVFDIVSGRARLIVYVKICEPPLYAMSFVGGQNEVKCSHHGKFLCVEMPGNSLNCAAEGGKCKRVVAWSCPSPNCHYGVCKKHLQSSDAEVFGDQEAITVKGPTVAVDDKLRLDCDAGDFARYIVKQGSTESNHKPLPLHLLLNVFYCVLHRAKKPIFGSKAVKRFFQLFAAKSSHNALSLEYVEAMLFPSIFYHQCADGSFPGALPFFLYGSEEECAKFGFCSLLDHMQTRIKDCTLQTSGNATYVQFASECVLNNNLNQTHTSDFFKRGLQSIRIGKNPVDLYVRDLAFSSYDPKMRVKQLLTAFFSDPLGMFVTFTLNSKKHPGVAPIFTMIEENFGQSPQEVKKSAIQSYMTLILRAWSRTMYYFIQLLLHSEELLLGPIKKFWCRAEFQTTAGNMQHYHGLVWSLLRKEELWKYVQCSEKTIFAAFRDLFHSDLKLITSQKQLNELYEDCVRIHSHNCEQGNYRCHKRQDIEQNTVCRQPAFPNSHTNWIMNIETQYPIEALKILHRLGMAERKPGFRNALTATEPLTAEKAMYAASSGEHILPTNVKLFCITQSSTNVLLTPSQRFSSSYLANYAGKESELEECSLSAGVDNKSFRIRQEGIQNRALATVRHALKEKKTAERQRKEQVCRHVAETEAAFWLLQLPYVFSTMHFVHVQNVSCENRYVCGVPRFQGQACQQVTLSNFRDFIPNLPGFKQVTFFQTALVQDSMAHRERLDKMSHFSLRPPELLCVKSVDLFFRWFFYDKRCSASSLVQVFRRENLTPWIAADGNYVKMRPHARDEFHDYLRLQERDEQFYPESVQYNLRVIQSLSDSSNHERFLLPRGTPESRCGEVVFSNVHPRNASEFLVSFVLRFGQYETELQLFSTNEILDSYIIAGLIEEKENYTDTDVNNLLNLYVRNELAFLPGGTLKFSARLYSAHDAFRCLLNLSQQFVLTSPTVLVNEIHDKIQEEVREFFTAAKAQLHQALCSVPLSNVPALSSLPLSSYWRPSLATDSSQSPESQREQQLVLQSLLCSVDKVIEGYDPNMSLKYGHVVLGPPGTGKSVLSSVALCHALCNGLVCYVTSLAARRATQLGGQHIHKMFCLSTKSLSASSLCDEALVRLSTDLKRKCFLEKLQVLVVEEVSLISGELWSTMSLILKRLKGSDKPFGGVLVIANGDCCQLPSVTGSEIFQSTSLIFNFHFHFLTQLVRMADSMGQRVLRLLEPRPVAEASIDEIIEIVSNECTFVDSWEEIADRSVMKVFGKKAAEREALKFHEESIRNSDLPFLQCPSSDEMCSHKSQNWRPADEKVSGFLNNECREPQKLLLYPDAVLRLTQNFDNVVQGQIGVAIYDQCSLNAVRVALAPNPQAVTSGVLLSRSYLSWPVVTLRRRPGFVLTFRGLSVRRTQFPASNYVALTVHKLMGDTFVRLATAISSVETKYTVWLPSQIYVILSRVHELRNLVFVGPKDLTLQSMRQVLRRRNLHEELTYQFFERLKERNSVQCRNTLHELPASLFLRTHFDVPETSGGFVFLLLSMRDKTYRTFTVDETDRSLSECLRDYNSTDCDDIIYSMQPWAVGFFLWGFRDVTDRQLALSHIRSTLQQKPSFEEVVDNVRMNLYRLTLCVCGAIVKSDF